MTPTPQEPVETGRAESSTPFHDLDAFVALPRISGLRMSPDGSALVVAVSTVAPNSQRYRTSLWRVDPLGEAPAVRLTRGAEGEAGTAFTSTGDLLFTAKRSDPEDAEPTPDRSPLWMLPADGGEARVIASRTGGFAGVLAASGAPVVVTTAPVLPGAAHQAGDDAMRKARKDSGVAAILHDGYPVRFWDHDLGPDQPHLLAGRVPVGDARLELRDLTPEPGFALVEQGSDLSSDGRMVVTGWNRRTARAAQISEINLIEVDTGKRRVLRTDDDADLIDPHFSPDGTCVAYVREVLSTPERAVRMWAEVITLADGDVVRLGSDWDRWPSSLTWLPDASGLLVTADQDGRDPVFRLGLDGTVQQITQDDFTYSDVVVAPDGRWAYALRSSYLAAAHPVRISLVGEDFGATVPLPSPSPIAALPGTLVEVRSTAADGVPVRGWLALPTGADAEHRAPLLLWIHGGPLGSWNAWSWRWTPWVMVAAGYAVLLPDPALSTGYGQHFVERGWGRWGGAPFTDLMAITDEVVLRDDIDADHTAAMGGSFGGYMANWVAGHTDRFKAVVTHASLWSLDEFGGTTDAGYYWDREMSPGMTAENSPHLSVSKISAPMLVIHGDKDYRVPNRPGPPSLVRPVVEIRAAR